MVPKTPDEPEQAGMLVGAKTSTFCLEVRHELRVLLFSDHVVGHHEQDVVFFGNMIAEQGGVGVMQPYNG